MIKKNNKLIFFNLLVLEEVYMYIKKELCHKFKKDKNI